MSIIPKDISTLRIFSEHTVATVSTVPHASKLYSINCFQWKWYPKQEFSKYWQIVQVLFKICNYYLTNPNCKDEISWYRFRNSLWVGAPLRFGTIVIRLSGVKTSSQYATGFRKKVQLFLRIILLTKYLSWILNDPKFAQMTTDMTWNFNEDNETTHCLLLVRTLIFRPASDVTVGVKLLRP